MIIHDVAQRSPEWFSLRCGRLTSSVAADILREGRKKGEESVSRRDLRLRLALERVTGQPQERDFQPTQAMQNGIDREAEALALYEVQSGHLVSTCGFIAHDTLMAGASLDAYVGDVERECFVVELKCPKAATHWATYQGRTIAPDYLAQIQHQLWMVPTATHAEFVSYCPEFTKTLQMVRLDVPRFGGVEAWIQNYDSAARLFLGEVDAMVAAIHAAAEQETW